MIKENKTTFFDRIRYRLAPSEFVKVRAAYYMAKFGHRAQTRKELGEDGNPLRYFEHPRRAAIILMDEFEVYDPDLICATLLHDCMEDTDAIDEHIIEYMFGPDVACWVTCLTKRPGEDNYVIRLLTSDPEACLIKACDRIDNLRSLPKAGDKPLTSEKKKFLEKQVEETKRFNYHRVWEKASTITEKNVTEQVYNAVNKAISDARLIPDND